MGHKILIIGSGYIGSVIAQDLTETLSSAEITISDGELEKAEVVASNIGRDNIRCIELNGSDHQSLISTLKGFDIAVGLTPGRVGYDVVKASIQAGVDIVDLSYMPQDPVTLNEEAIRKGTTVIPDCGVAPGLSHILVGRAASRLNKVREALILVGGIPEVPIPPLGYKVTWCAEDLVEEYVREAKIIKGGRQVIVKALDGLEEIDFPGIGRLEAFYTDGVRTLHHTLKGVENMWEKTLRYPGHAEKIKLLMDLGFFDGKPVNVRGINVTPQEFTTMLLERRLSMPGTKDIVAMKIEVIGDRERSEITYTYHLLDRYDEERKITAMARTTAYTASIIIQLLAKQEISEKGVIPPEKLGMKKEVFDKIMVELKKKGIKIIET